MAMSGFEQRFIKLQFSGGSRLRIYRKLERFIRNGITITNALETIWRHSSQDGRKPKNPSAVVVDAWRRQINEGKSLGVAVAGWVPENDRVVIEAGSQSDLPSALENACFLHESQRRIRSALIAGLAYPIVLVLVAVGFMVIFGTQVIPAFETILPRDQWTGVGYQMSLMADFVSHGLLPLSIAVVLLTIAMIWSMPRWTGPMRVKADAFAPYSIYRLVAGSGFLLSLGALVKAGVPIPSVLRLLKKDAKPWYAERLTRTLAHVDNGHDIGEALYRTGMNFPDKETVNDLRSYAMLEGFDEMLTKLGRENIEQTVERIESQTATLRNGGIIILGGVFAWIAIGIFSLQEQITAAF